MPRRASSGISKSQIIGLGIAVLVVCVVGFLLIRILTGDLIGGSGASSRAASDLNIVEYLENANSLRGNVYRVSGTIEEQLRWTENDGRLFSLDAEHDGDRTPIPIRVPQEFSKQNIDRGGEFRFVVEVGKDGLLIARQVEKI